VWAEVLTYVRAGERLYLDAALEALARAEQRDAMEMDEREGIVREYLDRLLPDDWEKRNVWERRAYIFSPDDPTLPRGTRLRDTVSNIEIWCECFGKKQEDLKPRTATPSPRSWSGSAAGRKRAGQRPFRSTEGSGSMRARNKPSVVQAVVPEVVPREKP
jgi:hypothetical protein